MAFPTVAVGLPRLRAPLTLPRVEGHDAPASEPSRLQLARKERHDVEAASLRGAVDRPRERRFHVVAVGAKGCGRIQSAIQRRLVQWGTGTYWGGDWEATARCSVDAVRSGTLRRVRSPVAPLRTKEN